MGRTVLQMVNQAQRELGLPVSTTVVNNPDATTTQMFGLLQYALEELRKVPDKGWTKLQKERDIAINVAFTATAVITENSADVIISPGLAALGINEDNFDSFAISGNGIPPAARILDIIDDTHITMSMQATADSDGTVTIADYIYDMFGAIIYDMFGEPILNSTDEIAAETIQFGQDTYSVPSDFDAFQNYTWWDRTNHWMLIGPTSPQIDQWHKSGIVATGPRRYWRQHGPYPENFQIWPPPFEIVNPIQTVFEYKSTFAVQVEGGTHEFAATFENDSDTCLLDDRVLIMAIKWRFWEQKGMNWASKRKEYDDRVNLLIAQDGGADTLPLSRRQTTWLISGANVQDGYFPGRNT